jgi:hypothetical protein
MLHVLHVTDERTRDTDRRGHETDAFNATRTADRLKEGTEQLALPDLSELSASAKIVSLTGFWSPTISRQAPWSCQIRLKVWAMQS